MQVQVERNPQKAFLTIEMFETGVKCCSRKYHCMQHQQKDENPGSCKDIPSAGVSEG